MSIRSSFKKPAVVAILIQVGIVLLLIAWFKIALPGIERARAASLAATREAKIQDLFQSVVVEDTDREVETPGENGPTLAHPQRLRITPSADDLERALGPATSFYVDFRQGRHLVWIGTEHKLEASFDKDRLYCLRIENLRTGHGSLVFDSGAQWQGF